MDVDEPASLRPAEADWALAFDEPSDLQALVNAIAAVLQRTTFKIVPGGGGAHYTLKADGADLGMTCCVSVRLRLERDRVRLNEERVEFCVDCQQMKTALDSAACVHAAIELQGRGDVVVVVVTDQEQRREIERCEIVLPVKGWASLRLLRPGGGVAVAHSRGWPPHGSLSASPGLT